MVTVSDSRRGRFNACRRLHNQRNPPLVMGLKLECGNLQVSVHLVASGRGRPRVGFEVFYVDGYPCSDGAGLETIEDRWLNRWLVNVD